MLLAGYDDGEGWSKQEKFPVIWTMVGCQARKIDFTLESVAAYAADDAFSAQNSIHSINLVHHKGRKLQHVFLIAYKQLRAD